MAKAYSVGLVGESNYQAAVRALRPGEHVELVAEPDNPHDLRAIAVRDGDGATVGYLPRDHWLADAMLDEGKGFSAEVKELTGGGTGEMTGVVLTVVQSGSFRAIDTDPKLDTKAVDGPATGGILAQAGAAAAAAATAKAAEIEAERKARGDQPKGVSKGCLWAIGIGLGLVLLVILVPTPEKSGDPNETAKTIAGEPDVALRADAKRWYRAVIGHAQPCDDANEQLANLGAGLADGSSSMMSAYQAASRSREACRSVWLSYDDLDVPASFEGEMEDKAEEALDRCKTAYFTKSQAAEAAMTVFDGDMRPSAVEEMRKTATDGNTGMMACVASAMSVAMRSGLTSEQLSAD